MRRFNNLSVVKPSEGADNRKMGDPDDDFHEKTDDQKLFTRCFRLALTTKQIKNLSATERVSIRAAAEKMYKNVKDGQKRKKQVLRWPG